MSEVTQQQRADHFNQTGRYATDEEISVEAIQVERQSDWGDASDSHENIAKMWSAYLERKFGTSVEVNKTDVAIMMTLLKASRFAFSQKEDAILDLASYADLAFKFEKK